MTFEELEPWLEKALDIVKIVEIVILSIMNHRLGKTEKDVATLACSGEAAAVPVVSDPAPQAEPVADTKRVAPTRLRDAAEAEFKKALELYFSDTPTEELTEEQQAICARVTTFLER